MAPTKSSKRKSGVSWDDAAAPRSSGLSRKRAADHEAKEEVQPPRKRRAAAAASLKKVKDIADDEEQFSEDEKIAAEDDAAYGEEAADEDIIPELNTKGLTIQDVLPIAAELAIAPGFRLWKTDSKLMSRDGETMQVAKIDNMTTDYTRVLEVHYPELFTLVPLVISQGPYKGRHVFMLEPRKGFPLLELPAEIRTMIFSYLLKKDEPITMTTAKRNDQPRRSVQAGWNSQARHPGLKWDRSTHTWIGQPPSPYALLRTSKQVLKEAAAIAYGDNVFNFPKIMDLKYFLESVGGMRAHLRHISLGSLGWQNGRARATFKMLKDAVNLRTVSFDYSNVCWQPGNNTSSWWTFRSSRRGTTSFQRVVATLKPAMIGLKYTDDRPADQSVLDIIKVHYERCHRCKLLAPNWPDTDDGCYFRHNEWGMPGSMFKGTCKDAEAACRKMERKMRKALAASLGIVDPLEEAKRQGAAKALQELASDRADQSADKTDNAGTVATGEDAEGSDMVGEDMMPSDPLGAEDSEGDSDGGW